MKLRKLTLITAIAFGMFACGNNTETKESVAEDNVDVTNKEEVVAVAYTVDLESSIVGWKGEIVGGMHSHNGVIAIQKGSLDLAGDALTGGTLVIDMTTVQALDENFKDEDGHRKEDLIGHLTSGDFFLVETYPTATFVIKSMADNKIVGDLTIRDKTKEETVDLSEFNVTEGGVSAKGSLVFNRQDYDVAYKSAMENMVISNDIALELTISATK